MVKKILWFVFLTMMLFINQANEPKAAVITIETVSNQFIPMNVNATVGDTIRWIWVSGFHTTTCNGTLNTFRPAGAAPWNAPLDPGNPSFSYVITVPGKYGYVCAPHSPGMAGLINAVPSSVNQITTSANTFGLYQNYPNPFNPVTKIRFEIPESGDVTLKVYNELGKEVETLVNSRLNQGEYEVQWTGDNVGSGVYYYSITSGEYTQTRKMLLIK